MRVKPPSPFAYCIPLYFGLAYCVQSFFSLAYCIPLNNITPNLFWHYIYIKKIKWQYVACTIIFANVRVDAICLLEFLVFYLPKSMFKFINAEMIFSKRRIKSLECFYFVCHPCCVFLMIFKVKMDVCVRYNRIFAYCLPTRLNAPWILHNKRGGVTRMCGEAKHLK